MIPQVFGQLKTRKYLPNKNGYVLIAEVKTPMSRNPGKWKLRIISEPSLMSIPEKPLEVWLKPIVQDFEEVFVQNKYNTLFRSTLKVKDGLINHASIQVTYPGYTVKLQLFENDTEVFCQKGAGTVTIPSFTFHFAEDVKVEKPKDATKPLSAEKVFFQTFMRIARSYCPAT